jgi:hypothetical protein
MGRGGVYEGVSPEEGSAAVRDQTGLGSLIFSPWRKRSL